MLRGIMVSMQISRFISADQTYNIELYKGSTSFSLLTPFSLDVKGGDKFGVWREDFVFTGVFARGIQTPKWFSSSTYGVIVGIMGNVLSLMGNVLSLIKMYLMSILW